MCFFFLSSNQIPAPLWISFLSWSWGWSRHTRAEQREKPSQPFLFICVQFWGGRGFVSAAIKLILAPRNQSPPSPGRVLPWKGPVNVLMDGVQAASLSLSTPQPADITHSLQEKQEMYSSICLVFNKVLELP